MKPEKTLKIKDTLLKSVQTGFEKQRFKEKFISRVAHTKSNF
jgi:hypothetical protein